VSLVDKDRVWFKAKVGLDGDEVARNASLCALMIDRPAFIEIEDLARLPAFEAHPAVAKDPHFRFYAAHPLITGEGECIGLVVVLDTKPRTLTKGQREALKMLGHLVMDQLELRRSAFRLEAVNRDLAIKKEQKARLMAVLSHEVRNNLTALLGFADLMQEVQDPARLAHQASAVGRCARHSFDILNNVLESVQAEASGRWIK
jgi:GAF domain-containing protein